MAGVIQLHSADSSEHLQALAEVSHFALTDMGQAGQGPWTYRNLSRCEVTSELYRLSDTLSSPEASTDALSFQPSPAFVSENQDRYVVQTWDLLRGTWVFCAVLDGHVNSHCVNYVRDTLPPLVRESLIKTLEESTDELLVSPEAISKTLGDVLVDLDNNLTSRLLQLVPQHLLEADRAGTVADLLTGNLNYQTASICLGGSAVIFSLLSPAKRNLWIANLGDCQAVLGYTDPGGEWRGTIIGDAHNVYTDREIQRIGSEHPDEPHCIQDGRVLGYFEPTRAVGDTWVKVAKQYTECLFVHLVQDWISNTTLRRCAEEIRSPPYLSNIPDVHHHVLSGPSPHFLLLCSDGLKELYEIQGPQLIDHWASIVGGGVDSGDEHNLAMRLLQDAIGGEDLTRASQILTVEMEDRWIDDTTILIQRIRV